MLENFQNARLNNVALTFLKLFAISNRLVVIIGLIIRDILHVHSQTKV